MANITNVQATTFCNEQVRPMADALATAYWTAKSIVAFWNANSVSSVIPNTSDVVQDGAANDGRQILTGIGATAIITRAMEFISTYEANGNAELNTVLAVAVNGLSKI